MPTLNNKGICKWCGKDYEEYVGNPLNLEFTHEGCHGKKDYFVSQSPHPTPTVSTEEKIVEEFEKHYSDPNGLIFLAQPWKNDARQFLITALSSQRKAIEEEERKKVGRKIVEAVLKMHAEDYLHVTREYTSQDAYRDNVINEVKSLTGLNETMK